ncbi:hypothetical protein Pla22_40360 [Rubripirellula amarantea]|uniref:BON domain-containing protein n=1 Tax=Rubripirellula amarantea TaxID=2527999 RepID=A0A5C5WMD5_9BACT|nr:hypothetical protein [Rubripirellula amarantea]TWT51259.1 hypothetical protein Pla22_40360 [Rubripirellula amarantea]
MTLNEIATRDRRTREKIAQTFRNDRMLQAHADSLQIDVQDSRVVISGELPSETLVQLLLPAIRRVGVLSQVSVNVSIRSQAA